ncbi:MAG TPA: hypothetical protein VM261_08365 [Kofleriaceae bacterium]|nr:hypothetical protein [Kofleriaceae bacterium]
MRSSSFVTILLCAAVPTATLSVPAAFAQPKPVDKTKAAKEYVDAGLAAQGSGDYDTALVFFGKAYELVPHPTLLFNMAQAHRLAGRATIAIDFYKKYVAADPKGPQVKTANELITALEVQIASEAAKAEAAKAEEARQAEEAHAAEEARKAEEARLAEEARKAEEARLPGSGGGSGSTGGGGPIEPPPPSDGGGKPGGAMRIAGLATAGVGVGAVGVGLFVFGAKASKLSDELSEQGAVYDPQKIEDGEAADRNMMICVVAGGAMVIGGAVIYMMGRRNGSTGAASAEHTVLVPTLSPDGVGFALTGTLP